MPSSSPLPSAVQALEAQRQIIMDAQLEATEALAAGENELAAALARDVELRKVAYSLQQAANMGEEEAFARRRETARSRGGNRCGETSLWAVSNQELIAQGEAQAEQQSRI